VNTGSVIISEQPEGGADGALGSARLDALAELRGRADRLAERTDDAFVAEVTNVPFDEQAFDRLRATTINTGEQWVAVETGAIGRFLALDDVEEAAGNEPVQAVSYAPLHSQLVAWWLFHAWRSTDLVRETIISLQSWRPYASAVTGRAVIEHCGSVVYESRKIATAWTAAKESDAANDVARAETLRAAFTPLLVAASFGTRLSEADGRSPSATSVLTYVQKLARVPGMADVTDWYDWLSDAAHPAFGARIAGSSDPVGHPSKAVFVRYHARAPLQAVRRGEVTRFQYPIATYAADAVVACGGLMFDILEQMLPVVDDFGLTTKAGTYSTRDYWRKFIPVRGTRPCPCGRGPWSSCGHWWGEAAPALRIPS
jgi:hypothetical protein